MNDVKLTILNFLTRVTRPTHWIKIHPHSRVLDHYLLWVIENDKVKGFRTYTALVDNKDVWISNYPYGYGEVYRGFAPLSGKCCGSYVAVKFRKYLENKIYEKVTI